MGYTDKFTRMIMEEAGKYKGRREVARAGILEIITKRYLPPDQLHPNPEDEFCDPDVVPNERILENYMEIAQQKLMVGEDCFDEPIMVAKMKAGEYMIINGHHRWAAAIKTELKRVRVVITNPGTEDLVKLL